MANLRELCTVEGNFAPGHRACVGCGCALAVRQVLLAVQEPVVAAVATGCLEIFSTIYPYTAWRNSLIHSAFENSAATIAGTEAAYKALKRRRRLPVDTEIRFFAFGGDGGTYDIGLQALSGALERRHRFVYVCYDNQAYMNTGIQRSSATPIGASTTTSPVGVAAPGKLQPRKDLTEIVIAHRPAYAATGTPGFWNDLVTKVRKAAAADGPAFINILGPCQLGWGYLPELTIELSKLAVDTCFWPLYEWEDGRYKLTYTPRAKKPLADWLKAQTRFKHLFSEKNRPVLEELQRETDARWEELKSKAGAPSG